MGLPQAFHSLPADRIDVKTVFAVLEPMWDTNYSVMGGAIISESGRHHSVTRGGFARNRQPATSFGSRSSSTSSGCIRVSRSAIATVEDLLAARGLDISCETVRR